MSIAAKVRAEPRDHLVQFYESDDELVATVSAYLSEGLLAGELAIVVATEAHTVAFDAALSARGIDVAEALGNGTLVTLDAAATLSRFMIGGGPDAGAFDAVIGGVVRQAARSGRPIRAFGEMVALLWDAGRVAEAIELESLWNELGLQVPFSLFCAYPSRSVVGDDQAHALHEVCHLHSAIVGQTAPPSAREFDRETHAPRAARRFVAEQLEQWGRDELVDDAAVVVTELATNAVVHATSEFTVSMSLSEGCVRIAVRDASAVLPTLRELGSTNATSGRGIALVAAIASQWGAEQMADGKIVWAKLGA